MAFNKARFNLKKFPTVFLSSSTIQEASLTEKLGLCLSLLSAQRPKNGSLPRTIPLIARVPWDPEMQVPLATRARQSATKLEHQI